MLMGVLDKIEKINSLAIRKIEWIGLAGLLLMMVITCIDVVGAKIFLNPIHGGLDTVELAQLIAMSFAAAATLMHGRHVQVEFFVILLPKRVQTCVDFVIHGLGLVLFVIIVWRLASHAHYYQVGGQVSATARIALYPFVYGAALATIPVCIVFLLEFVKSFSRMVKK
jgi:TRAP-type C4-dicarboxylate transport system permease small subunit